MAFPTLWRTGTPAVWNDVFPRREIDRVFDRLFAQPGLMEGPWVPAVDVRETRDAVEVLAELPGLHPDDVAVHVENNVLTISGEKKQEATTENGAEYHLVERRAGRFERSFTLPRTVDAEKITAAFSNGLLTVTLPKAEVAKPRKVTIRSA